MLAAAGVLLLAPEFREGLAEYLGFVSYNERLV